MSSKKGKKKNLREKFEKGLDAIKRTLTSNKKSKKHGLLNGEEVYDEPDVPTLAYNSDNDFIRGASGKNPDIVDPQLEYSQAVNKGSTVNLEESATSSYDDSSNNPCDQVETRERPSKVFSGDGCVRPRPRSGNFPGAHVLRPASSARHGYSGLEKRLADQAASRGSTLGRYAQSENILLDRHRLSSGYGSNPPDDDLYQSMLSLRGSITTLAGSVSSLNSEFTILQQQLQELASKFANLPFNMLESEQWDNNSELMRETKAVKNATQQALKECRGNKTVLEEAMRFIKEHEQMLIELTAMNANHQTYDAEDDNETPENYNDMNHDETFAFPDDERF